MEHGTEQDSAFTGVRDSYLLDAIHELGKKFPPAEQVLHGLQREAEALVVADGATMEDVTRFVAINRAVEQPELSVTTYRNLVASGASGGTVVVFWFWVLEHLFGEQRFAEIATGTDMTKRWVQMFGGMDELSDALAPGKNYAPLLGRVAAMQYSALLAVGRKDEAASFADDVTAEHARVDVFRALVHAAREARESEEAVRILAKAQTALPPAEFEAVQQASACD
ncbi:MAG: hypothetical protein IT373_34400 [Polyangiaceae bacterium]|nr:hypothetical protein [Polyangiaceae bacterium]